MPNRADRRAQSRSKGNDRNSQEARSRAGLLDEYALQEQARRIEEGVVGGEWKPTSNVQRERNIRHHSRAAQPTVVENREWTALRVLTVIDWVILLASIIGFAVVIWWKTAPIAYFVGVTICFAIGVIGLFALSGRKRNPNVDSHGTAV